MAQDRKSALADTGRAAPTKAVADAAHGVLGFAMHANEEAPAAEALASLSGLTALCDRAADHMALAHSLLVGHENNADTAAEHLDAALACLRQVAAEGAPRKAEEPAAAVSEARSA